MLSKRTLSNGANVHVRNKRAPQVDSKCAARLCLYWQHVVRDSHQNRDEARRPLCNTHTATQLSSFSWCTPITCSQAQLTSLCVRRAHVLLSAASTPRSALQALLCSPVVRPEPAVRRGCHPPPLVHTKHCSRLGKADISRYLQPASCTGY